MCLPRANVSENEVTLKIRRHSKIFLDRLTRRNGKCRVYCVALASSYSIYRAGLDYLVAMGEKMWDIEVLNMEGKVIVS